MEKKKKRLGHEDQNHEVALCYKHTVGEDQNQYVRIASIISNNDLNFLALLDAESGNWTIDRKSPTNDHGFCQINAWWHPQIVNDPRFFQDAEWQLQRCWELYKNGTKFYAIKNVWKTKTNFTCPKS